MDVQQPPVGGGLIVVGGERTSPPCYLPRATPRPPTPSRLLKNPFGLSFRGVPQLRDDEESRLVFVFRPRFLAEFTLSTQGEILPPEAFGGQDDIAEGSE